MTVKNDRIEYCLTTETKIINKRKAYKKNVKRIV